MRDDSFRPRNKQNRIIRQASILGLTGVMALVSLPCLAAPYPPQWAALKRTVIAFVRAQTAALPGQVEIDVGQIDTRLHPPPCADLVASVPAGSRLWGASIVHLECPSALGWQLNVAVRVHVTAPVVILAANVSAGQLLSATDLSSRPTDLTQLPAGFVRDPAEAIGKVMQFPARAGSVLRQQMYRLPWVIKQGQTVPVVAQGPGFRLTTEGVAINNASQGQMVRVRTVAGKTLTATAEADGHAEIIDAAQ